MIYPEHRSALSRSTKMQSPNLPPPESAASPLFAAETHQWCSSSPVLRKQHSTPCHGASTGSLNLLRPCDLPAAPLPCSSSASEREAHLQQTRPSGPQLSYVCVRRRKHPPPPTNPPTSPLPALPETHEGDLCPPRAITKARSIDDLVWSYIPSNLELELDRGMSMLMAKRGISHEREISDPLARPHGPRSVLPFGYIYENGEEWRRLPLVGPTHKSNKVHYAYIFHL